MAGSATDASALLAGITISAAVGGPVLGVLLDRAGRPGRLLAGALVLYAAGLGMILVGLDRLPFAVTVLIAVPTGLLGPALSGGWTAQLPRVVPGDRLPRANALDAMTFGVASLAGPALMRRCGGGAGGGAGGGGGLRGAHRPGAARRVDAAFPSPPGAGPSGDLGGQRAGCRCTGHRQETVPRPSDPELGRVLCGSRHADSVHRAPRRACPGRRRPWGDAALLRGGLRPGGQRRTGAVPTLDRARHSHLGRCSGPGRLHWPWPPPVGLPRSSWRR